MTNSCICRAPKRCGVCRRIPLFLLAGLAFGGAPDLAVTALAQSTASAPARPIASHIAEASQRFGIPRRWIVAMLQAESAGDVRAVSSAGAMGLMQVMPGTWAELRVRHSLGRDPYDPHDNILAGTAYLRELWDRYGNLAAMLAAYNAGPTRYDEHRATGRPLPAETRAYVAKLVPALGTVRPTKGSSAVVRPCDWRGVGVFAARDRSAARADLLQPPGPADGPRFPVPAPSETLTGVQSKGLFVSRTAVGGQP
ncbi:Transglycosylase SLT domain-containing protein [Mesorhizobium sp. NFR06]|uniref:lytic transglycosylase domain-containing protein n=1 Tax=Mesorhizobium sp. NFR06 TaxID=1566290 RepID=UPI0008F34DA2|nr:lytic transglycosylase domain-containing protein [Mesorhizobium sp. NFR06]SFO01069.1 Transglycosylase SLT domain-containing protein [Mesorhizobium sp. NFR06]